MGPSVDVRALSALFSECEMSSLADTRARRKRSLVTRFLSLLCIRLNEIAQNFSNLMEGYVVHVRKKKKGETGLLLHLLEAE